MGLRAGKPSAAQLGRALVQPQRLRDSEPAPRAPGTMRPRRRRAGCW